MGRSVFLEYKGFFPRATDRQTIRKQAKQGQEMPAGQLSQAQINLISPQNALECQERPKERLQVDVVHSLSVHSYISQDLRTGRQYCQHTVSTTCVCGFLPRISFHLQNPLRGLVVPGCTSLPSLFLPPFPSILQLPSTLASETDENFHLLWLNLA